MVCSYLSPNSVLSALTLGISLAYWELCSPGRVLPGTLGGVLLLASIWILAQRHPTPVGAALLSAAVLLFVADARHPKSVLAVVVATAILSAGLHYLFRGPQRIAWWMAVPAASLLGFETGYLARVASQARTNKRHEAKDH